MGPDGRPSEVSRSTPGAITELLVEPWYRPNVEILGRNGYHAGQISDRTRAITQAESSEK